MILDISKSHHHQNSEWEPRQLQPQKSESHSSSLSPPTKLLLLMHEHLTRLLKWTTFVTLAAN